MGDAVKFGHIPSRQHRALRPPGMPFIPGAAIRGILDEDCPPNKRARLRVTEWRGEARGWEESGKRRRVFNGMQGTLRAGLVVFCSKISNAGYTIDAASCIRG